MAAAKGKAVVVDDETDGSTTTNHHGDFGSHVVDRLHDDDAVYSAHLPPTTSSRIIYTQYVDPAAAGYCSPAFLGGAVPPHQHVVRTGNQQLLYAGIGSSSSSSSTGQHVEFYHHRANPNANANGEGGAGAAFPSPHTGHAIARHYAPSNSGRPRPRSPLPWSMEQIDSFIGNSLRSLSIRDRDNNSLLARGHQQLSSSEFVNYYKVPPQHLVVSTNNNGQNNNNNHPAASSLGHDLFLHNNNNNADQHQDQQYAGRRLEYVRGTMRSVVRNPSGCRFLARMVAEGGAAAAEQVLDEVAGDVVRLMVQADGHALVEALVHYLADEHTERVLQVLDAANPAQIVAVAKSHQGSNILQTLIGRIAGDHDHAELFTRTLARVGERGVLSLMLDMDGSRLVIRCLDTFSAANNQFITVAMATSLHRVCRDRHGCHVMNKCIDRGAGVDVHTWSSLVHAVCCDAFALAEHVSGNYVVQHVIKCVPGARASLHAAFRGRYVGLSRQMASSNVVQRCLELFAAEQADEIVAELLGCRHWGCTFQEIISDRFANYVLQTAMERTEIQMHNRLLNGIIMYSHELRDNIFARNLYRKLGTLRRSYRLFRAA